MDSKLCHNTGRKGKAASNDVYDPSEVEETIKEKQSHVPTEMNSDDSTIALDDDEDEKIPSEQEIMPVSENVQTSKNNEDDLSIVYENISPLSEVQIVSTTLVHHQPFPKIRRKVKGRKHPFLGNSDTGDVAIVNETESSNINSLDDSVSIVDEVAAPMSNLTDQSRATSVISSNLSYTTGDVGNVNTNDSSNISSLDDSVCVVAVVPPLNMNRSVQSQVKSHTTTPSNLTQNPNSSISNSQSTENSQTHKKPRIVCSVCFDSTEEILASGRECTSTVCGHFFCSECIKKAIKANKNCPKCRKRLNNKQYHPLYL